MFRLFNSLVIVFAISIASSCMLSQTLVAQQKDAKTKQPPPTKTSDLENDSDAARSFIKTIDQNGDGKISKDESPDQLKTNFQHIDKNNDDLIDAEEAQAIVDYIAKGGASTETASPSSTKMAAKPEASVNAVTAKQLVDAMDANGDSKISKGEASEDLILYFKNYDTNKDKMIDLNEAQAMATFVNQQSSVATPTAAGQAPPALGSAAQAKQLIAQVDSNQDGKVSLKEAPAELKPYFSQFDANGDGEIDVAEAKALVPHAGDALKDSVATKQSPNQPKAKGKVTAKDLMKQMDLNSDGKITKTEAPQDLKDSFQYVDTNDDGGIDEAEAQSMADYINKNGKQ